MKKQKIKIDFLRMLIILIVILVVYNIFTCDKTIYTPGTKHIAYEFTLVDRIVSSLFVIFLGWGFSTFYKPEEEIKVIKKR